MNKIIFPLKLRMNSPAVGDLQDALQLLLDRGVILANDEGARRELTAILLRERAEQTYGSGTRKLVSIFQQERQLQTSGAVDEATAEALNGLLRELGVFDPIKTASSTHVVSGAVRREDGLALRDVRVRAIHESDRSAIRLGEDTTDAEGRYTIRYEQLPEVASIHLRVSAIAPNGTRLQTSDVVRDAKPLEVIDLTVPVAGRPSAARRIEGRIVLEHGLPAEQMKLRLYRRDFGGAVTLLNETSTLAGGQYAFAYDPGGKTASIEVRAVKGANEEIVLSKPLNELSGESRAELNLVAPSTLQPLAAEYKRLSTDLTPHVGQMTKLAEAKEDKERQDITILNRATGWDARLIALAATTEKLSAEADVNLPQEAVYGLLRAGLPSDKLMLAQVGPDVVEQALKTVRDAGIVELNDQQIGDFKTAFTQFSNTVRLNIPAPGSHSSYAALLETSGLPQDVQNKFAPVYLNHRGDAAQLWEKARQTGLDEGQIRKLQLQGKFAFLAGNSAAMIAALMNKEVNDPAQLAAGDFHLPEQWKAEIISLTGNDENKLQELIPARYVAEKVADRLDAYVEDMARKFRQSYPTEVVGRLLEQDTFNLPVTARDATVTLMKKASKQGFRLGQTPVAKFLKTHTGVSEGMAELDFQAANQQIKTLQRVYQITPSNEAMPVLMSLGMTSAFDVMAYSETEFRDLYVAEYRKKYDKEPTPAEPQLIYRKANQASNVIYNLFTIAKKLGSEPPVAGMSAPVEVRESVRNELIKQFPTLESLFGSMDFCECEHCRSVLSPAAYLVDLLQFVDAEPDVWSNFLAHWKATHGNQDYPHKDNNGNPLTPYDVLIERRPDLPHIPLTCENTHTALPYIDIVNEILEYYVANGKLEEEAAHDTGEATTAELLAEPQNVIKEAYDKLRDKARYPLNLPFDLWLETVRQFCNYFEAPLARVMEVFRPSDDLFAPAQPFDRASLFMESLGLSPAEVAIFTDPKPLLKWHELYGFETADQALTEATDATTGQRIDLNSAKALSRRLGISYKEIAEIVQTGFVNPKLTHLHLLYKLGINIHDARFYLAHKGLLGQNPSALSSEDQKRQLEVQAFANELVKFAAAYAVTTAQLEAELQGIPFDEILVLADLDAGCNFDLTTLKYADGVKKADPIAFLRINLFVRLWRKLGWSIEETDRALCAFIPQSAPFDATPANLAKQPLKTALIYLAHLKTLNEKLRIGKQSLLKLLTLWSDIPISGKKPLYAQLFLTRSVLKTAPVFDHPLGRYLTDLSIKVKDHPLALQGALGLSADEIRRILEDNAKTLDAELSLANVSLLYRYSLLAKALKLSVRDLIALKQLSGVDPTKPLHADPLATVNEDYPFSQTLRFVEITEAVKNSGLKIEDLEYLLRHRFDETGKYRPDREGTLALLKTLAEGVHAIRAEHAVPDDAGAMSEEVLRQKLGLALTPDVVERFLAMMNGTAEFTATKTGVAAANKLDVHAFKGEATIRQVSYNAARQEQKLTFQGVLFEAQKTALQTHFDVVLTVPQKVAFAQLLGSVQEQAKEFFRKHLQKQAPDVQPASGFLDATDLDLLFSPMPDGLSETQQQTHLRQQRTKLAQAFLPFLQQRLIRQFIVKTMTAHTGADPVLVESLVIDERLLAAAGPQSLLDVFAATAESGLTATFFASADGSGAALGTVSLADANTGLKDKDGNPLKPAGANSARLEAYLEVPTPGAYRFYVALDKQDAEAELRFAHLPKPTLTGTASSDNDEIGDGADEYVELKPGIPYRFTLDLRKLNSGDARLLVQGETLAKDKVAQLALYPSSAMESGERAILLLTKTLQLVQNLGLNEREIRYMLSPAAAFDGLSFSQLPTRPGDDTPSGAQALFAHFLRLSAYARLKGDLTGGTDDLIDIFEVYGTGDLGEVYRHLAKLTRRDEAMIKASAESLFSAPSFASEKPLVRLWEVLQVAERFGVSVASLLDWTRIVSPTITPEQRFDIARDLKEAIKARLEPETWQRVAQPIFDHLRQRQRDALASHVMHLHGFDRTEQLYEYFLIDPGMEPVVQTSRIRLAISSLQLFIQHCLLNLELKVHPSVINAKQWEWMKRYRVWEANRKIFLFPENWLEPEFRDDKTHLFAELEGALLQGDVSNDLVEDAFLNYLKKLDELARLDIVAMHMEDNADPARRTLHVIGRTYNQPHKYFYRRYLHQMWTPWEPVSAEITGDHLAPVVWRDRLYLFWVTFMDKPAENAQPGPRMGPVGQADLVDVMKAVKAAGVTKQIDVQLHWSEYMQGEWITGESSGFVPVMTTSCTRTEVGGLDAVPTRSFRLLPGMGGAICIPVPLTVPLNFDLRGVLIHVSKDPDEDGEERGLRVHLSGPGKFEHSFYLAGRNSAPEKTGPSPKPNNPYSANTHNATRYSGSGELEISFQARISTEPGQTPPKANLSILLQGNKHTLVPCDNDLTALGVPEDAQSSAANAAAVKAAIERGVGELASLMKPVFYQDNAHTFFVEPSVTERVIEEWHEWVTPPPQPDPAWQNPGWWKDIKLIAELPALSTVSTDSGGNPFIDPGSVINPVPSFDWLLNPGTGLLFNGVLIGPTGQPGLEILTTGFAGDVAGRGAPINVNPGSGLASGSTVVLSDATTPDKTGLSLVAGGLNIVGSAGFNSALEKNFSSLNRPGSGADLPGSGRTER